MSRGLWAPGWGKGAPGGWVSVSWGIVDGGWVCLRVCVTCQRRGFLQGIAGDLSLLLSEVLLEGKAKMTLDRILNPGVAEG